MGGNQSREVLVFKLFYVCTSGVNGALATVIPLYFISIGLAQSNAPLVIALPSLVTLLQPLLGSKIDKYNITKQFALLCAVLTALMLSLMVVTTNLFFTLVIYFLYQLFRVPILSCIDNIILTYCLDNEYPYSKIRLYASIAWGSSLFIFMPLISNFGYRSFFIIAFVLNLINIYLIAQMSNINTGLEHQTRSLREIVSNPNIVYFLLYLMFFGSLIGPNPSYQSLLLVSLDASDGAISLAMFLSTFLMIFVMPQSERLEQRIGLKNILYLISVITVVKYLCFYEANSVWLVLLGASLNSLAMGLFIPIGVRVLRSMVATENSNFIISLNVMLSSSVAIIISIISSKLYSQFQINVVFLVFIGVILMASACLHRVNLNAAKT